MMGHKRKKAHLLGSLSTNGTEKCKVSIMVFLKEDLKPLCCLLVCLFITAARVWRRWWWWWCWEEAEKEEVGLRLIGIPTFFRGVRELSPRSFDTFRKRQVTPRCPHPTPPKKREEGRGDGGEEMGGGRMMVHLRAGFGAMTQVRLSVCMSVLLYLCFDMCVCVCVPAFMHIHVEACTL